MTYRLMNSMSIAGKGQQRQTVSSSTQLILSHTKSFHLINWQLNHRNARRNAVAAPSPGRRLCRRCRS